MLNEKQITEMLSGEMGDLQRNEIRETALDLWRIARAAKKWHKAAPGKDSSEAEYAMARLIEHLPLV